MPLPPLSRQRASISSRTPSAEFAFQLALTNPSAPPFPSTSCSRAFRLAVRRTDIKAETGCAPLLSATSRITVVTSFADEPRRASRAIVPLSPLGPLQIINAQITRKNHRDFGDRKSVV